MIDLIRRILDFGAGYRTYLAAFGLLGLALYQLSVGEYESALQSSNLALAAFGLRKAIETL